MPATPQQETLQSYLDDLRRLLHDPNDRYWSQADKIVYVNKGMQARDRDTGANRQLVPFVLTIGTDLYTFTTLGQAGVIDVIGINCIYGNQRIVLGSFSYTSLNTWARTWQPGLRDVPIAWCRYGPNQVLFAPVPSLAYATEWDVSVYSSPLVALTDKDPMPYPYTSPVPFYAAYWAKFNERQYDEAEGFREQYQKMLEDAVLARVGTLPNPYRGTMMTRVS